MKPFSFSKKILSVLVAASVMPAVAQTEAKTTGQISDPMLLNKVTVSATRTEQQLDEVASSIVVISAEQMDQQMASDIRDMVRYEPGVVVGSDSRFGLSGFNIRGMDQNRVKITVDGVNQAQSFGYKRSLQSQRNFVDIENVKQLEILKGPASSIHGSGAIGGVAAFVSKDPADYLNRSGDDTHLALKAGYHSVDSGAAESLTIANRTGNVESLLVYSRRDGKETENYFGSSGIGGEGNGREQPDPMNYSRDSLLGKVQYQINDNHRIGFVGEWLNANSAVNMLSANGGTYLNNRSDDNAKRTRLGVNYEWQADIAAFDYTKWSVNWQDNKTTQQTFDTRNSMISGKQNRLKTYSYSEKGYQLDGLFNKTIELDSSYHTVVYGLSIEDKQFENINVGIDYDTGKPLEGASAAKTWMPQVSRFSGSVFAQDQIELLDGQIVVTPGLRYDYFDESIGSLNGYADTSLSDSSYNNVSASLGAVFELNSDWSAFAQYSQGYGMPSMFSKYFDYKAQVGGMTMATVIANPNLQPEESNSYEIGLRYNSALASMELAAYYNDYSNFIEENCIAGCANPEIGATFQYQNLPSANIYGVEFKGGIFLDEAFGAPQGTRLTTAVAWAQGKGDKFGKDNVLFKDEPLNSIAPLTAVIGLGYDAPLKKWGSELMWTLVAAKNSDDTSTVTDVSMGGTHGEAKFTPAGYGTVDFTAYYKLVKDVTINAGIFNITNKKYWVWDDVRNLTTVDAGINRYTQPGRNYSVSVKWEV